MSERKPVIDLPRRAGARRVLTQSVLAGLSLLTAIVVCEATLRLSFPKYASIAEGRHYHADASRIWSPMPNSSHLFFNPDTIARVSVIYNEFGMRQHRLFDADKLGHATNVAFFGDSFTENRRIRSAYSFTESLDFFLNLREGAAFNVLNFGVEGYGPGQQFITYRQFEHRDELDHVVYVFCDNDVKDFHRHGLFSLNESEELVANTDYRTSSWRYMLSRLHLTYLVLDVAQRMELRSRDDARRPVADRAEPPPPTLLLGLGDIERRAVRRRQEGSAFSGDAADDSIAAFQALLRRWKQDVEARGGKFHVALLPYISKERVQEALPNEIDIVDLHGCFSDAIPNYSYRAVRFDNDYHWNEMGNMVAAHCLLRFLEEEAGLPLLSDDVLAQARYEFYRAVDLGDGWMPPPVWATRPATRRHDPDGIRAKYLALDRRRGERLLQSVEDAGDARLLAQAYWDVYRVQGNAVRRDSLVYVKAPCDEEDLASRFLLHVEAADPADLPPERRAFGYANLDFDFAQNDGSWVGERCVVGADLPAYGVAAVRTGQFSMDNGEIRVAWQVELAADETRRQGGTEIGG